MANVTVNGQNYTGVSEVRLPVTGGGGSEQSFVLPPSGTKNITANGNGIDVASYAAVNVNVPVGITPSGTKNITANGDYDVTQYAGAHVAVAAEEPTLQQKSVTAPASGTTSVTPDSGYDGLSKVTVSPTPTETKSITANGTYTPTSGKHFSQVTVNVSSSAPSTQEKTVSPSTSQQVVTPDSGKLLSKVTVNAIQTETKSATPSESAQTITPTGGKYLTSVSIGAISTSYVGSGVTRKAAQSYTPGTSNQTIAASQYLTGAQTILGDANLVASNIKDGVSIFGVNGTYSGGGSTVQTYTGTFSTDSNGHASVNCEFVPDIIIFHIFTDPADAGDGTVIQTRAVATLNGLSTNAWHESYFCVIGNNMGPTGFYTFKTRPTSNGFEVIYLYDGWGVERYPLSVSDVGTIQFTAYKF